MPKPEAPPELAPEEEPAEEVVREEEPADQLVEEEEEEPVEKGVPKRAPSDELVDEEGPSDELLDEEGPSDELLEEEGPSDELLEEEGPSDELLEEEGPVDGLPMEEAVEEETEDELPEEEEVEGELPEEEEILAEGEPYMAETGLAEQPVEQGRRALETGQSTPRVDLLANIIRWVANAKAEIGKEQLLTFLEVYGISGYLTPEFKEVIMHMAETTEPQPAGVTTADIWSRLMLELHGILTGGDAPLHPVKPFWNYSSSEAQLDEAVTGFEEEEAKPKEKPTKLKLVVTTGDGSDKEFCLDLNPEDGGES